MMLTAEGLMAISVWSDMLGSVGWNSVRIEECRKIMYMGIRLFPFCIMRRFAFYKDHSDKCSSRILEVQAGSWKNIWKTTVKIQVKKDGSLNKGRNRGICTHERYVGERILRSRWLDAKDEGEWWSGKSVGWLSILALFSRWRMPSISKLENEARATDFVR